MVAVPMFSIYHATTHHSLLTTHQVLHATRLRQRHPADLTLEEVFAFAADERFDCVELMCWPPGGADRRYAGVTHLDVTNVNDELVSKVRGTRPPDRRADFRARVLSQSAASRCRAIASASSTI